MYLIRYQVFRYFEKNSRKAAWKGVFMKTVLAVVSLTLLIPLAAIAQDEYPRAEVFGGYSFFRANPDGMDLHGWDASVAGNITKWFGVEGDVSGHYGSPKLFGFNVPFVDVSSYKYMVGPKLTYRSDKVAPFAHFLIGGTQARTKILGISASDTALATAIGGGVDINLNKSIAIRAIQADYLMTRFHPGSQIAFSGFDDHQNNFRISAGLVIRLGNH